MRVTRKWNKRADTLVHTSGADTGYTESRPSVQGHSWLYKNFKAWNTSYPDSKQKINKTKK